MTLRIRTLGPLEIEIDGRAAPLGGYKQSLVLGLLSLHANRVVPVNTIIDALWGDDPNDRAASTVQVYISNLRKLLEPASRARGRDVIITQRPGYQIALDRSELDALEFDHLLAEARGAVDRNDLTTTIALQRDALRLWRGEAFADLSDNEEIRGGALRLDNQRMTTLETCLSLELELGGHGKVVGELQGLVDMYPLNERLRSILMLALYRSGRQADALAVYQNGREHLLDELGIDPGPELRSLEHRILAQDRTLDFASVAIPAPGDATVVRSHVGIPTAELEVAGHITLIVRPITTIGRRADRDLVVDDPDVSRAHAEIRWTPEGFVLCDTGSTNGTFVDGARVREHLLTDEADFTVGSTVVSFRRLVR